MPIQQRDTALTSVLFRMICTGCAAFASAAIAAPSDAPATGAIKVSHNATASQRDAGWSAFENHDYAAAASAWKTAAEKGDGFSQFHLGWLYETGTGVPVDYAIAGHWYSVAAQAGWPGAEAALQRLSH